MKERKKWKKKVMMKEKGKGKRQLKKTLKEEQDAAKMVNRSRDKENKVYLVERKRKRKPKRKARKY